MEPIAGNIRHLEMAPDYWPKAVTDLSHRDPVIAGLIEAFPGESLVCRNDPFVTLAKSIVGQQISVPVAEVLWRRLEALLGAVAPAAVAGATDEALLGRGLSRAKVRYLRALAAGFVDGTIEPAGWSGRDDEAVIGELTRVKGVGRWTAQMFLIFNLVRPDVLPLDDIGLQRAMGRHYRGAGKLARDEIERIAGAWRPWRSVATWYLWRGLDGAPVEY